MGKQKNLLKRFLTGAASDEEAMKVENWLDELPQVNDSWTSLSDEDKEAFLKSLKEKIDISNDAEIFCRDKYAGWLWLVAATVIIMLMIPIYALWKKHPAQLITKAAVFKVIQTNEGEVRQWQMSDGSLVWLNAQSKIRFRNGFDSHSRDVYLEGQAFFEVARDIQRPFIVHASNLQVSVLGTHFDISDYDEDKAVSVSVLSGKVAVGSMKGQKAPVILNPGELLSYNKHSHFVSRSSFTVSEQPGWTKGEVVFYHTKMSEVANYIKRHYGWSITINDPAVHNMELSGNFGKIENVKELLDIICLTINAQYKTNEQKKSIVITQIQ